VKDKLSVEVTLDDIAKGERNGWCSCPIVLAFRRANPKADGVLVDGADVAWLVGNHEFAYKLPDDIANWLEAFDLGKDVEPTSFEVPLNEVICFTQEGFPELFLQEGE